MSISAMDGTEHYILFVKFLTCIDKKIMLETEICAARTLSFYCRMVMSRKGPKPDPCGTLNKYIAV